MKICYVDESGDTGVLPSATSPIQPAMVIAGIIIDHDDLVSFTHNFLNIKKQFFPGLFPSSPHRFLNGILKEVKGSEVRKLIAVGSRNQRRHQFGFLDHIISLLQTCNSKCFGRVWIKGIGKPINSLSLYTFSIQSIYNNFQEYLKQCDDIGVVVIDSRWFEVNRAVAHSVFTQKFRSFGDAYDRIVELPAFGHSDNHAGIQVCDLICSALLFPMAVHAYCSGIINNVHVRPEYVKIRQRYRQNLRHLRFGYQTPLGRWKGGYTVSDGLTNKTSSVLLSDPGGGQAA